MCFGSMVGAFTLRHGQPLYSFGFGAIVTGSVTLLSTLLGENYEKEHAVTASG